MNQFSVVFGVFLLTCIFGGEVDAQNDEQKPGGLFLLVTDPEENPLSGAWVDLSDCDAGSGRTDAEGKFYFKRLKETVHCRTTVRKTGFAEEVVDLKYFGRQSLVIVLTPLKSNRPVVYSIPDKGGAGWSVQLKASDVKPSEADFRKFEKFTSEGNLYLKKESKWFKIRLGVYMDKEKAMKALRWVKTFPDFKDAFLVREDDVDPALMIPYETQDVSPVTYGEDNIYGYESVRNTKVYSEGDNDASFLYAIQLGVVKKGEAIPELDFSAARETGNVYFIEENRQLKVMVGVWCERTEAEFSRSQLLQKGFTPQVVRVVGDDRTNNYLLSLESNDNPTFAAGEWTRVEGAASDLIREEGKKPDERNRKKKKSSYKIRLATTNDDHYLNDDQAEMLGGKLERRKTLNGLTVFLLGGFEGREEAEEALNQAHRKGLANSHLIIENEGTWVRVD